nr:hypothetical protein [Bdellovibrionales bacterium]
MTNWFALPLLFLGLTVQAAWFDQSHEIFMTEKLSAVASKYRDYPLFWWNFIVVDGKLTREEVEKLCADLWRENRGAIAKLPCAQGPESLQSLTTDWLKDLPRRRDWPGEAELSRAMNSGLVKASLPIPREVLNLLRSDPMNSLGDLRRQLDARARFNAPVEGGTIFESNDNRRWLPIQFAYSPADSARTIEFERVLGESQI